MKQPLEIHDIMVSVKKDDDGYWRATAYAEVDGVAARYEYKTEPQASYTKPRAICHALTALAVMFDRGEIKLEDTQ